MTGAVILIIAASAALVTIIYRANATFSTSSLEREVLQILVRDPGRPAKVGYIIDSIGTRRSKIDWNAGSKNPAKLDAVRRRPDRSQLLRAIDKLLRQGSIRYTTKGYLLTGTAPAE